MSARRPALGLALLCAAPAWAQQPAAPVGRCALLVTANSPATHFTSTKLPSGQYNNYIGGGVTARCPAQSLTLVADSMEYFGDTRIWHAIGHVHYTEPRITLDSQVGTYFMNDERLLAEGKVHAVLPSGTTLDGPRVEYLRAVPGVRTVARMTAPGRPTINVVQRDSAGRAGQPMVVVANTVVMDGDSLVYASGRVTITRPDVIATGDTAAMNSATEAARLMRGPVINSRGSRPFTLSGTVIDLFGQLHQLQRVIARGQGKGVSQDATITSDTLDFRLDSGSLQRVYAWGPSRARAVNPQYDILADSLDARMPAQRMREVRAVRRAQAQSVPDTLRLHTREHDWLRGDTIFARFDSSAPPPTDSTRQPELRQLLATGDASSYYHIAPKDTAAIGPAINYVKGHQITVSFLHRQLQSVTIVEQVAGVYLEPTVPGRDTTRGRSRPNTPQRPSARPPAP